MKIVVTGAGGFVGGHLIEALHCHDHDVVALGIGGEQKLQSQGVTVHTVNILDAEGLESVLGEEKPDAIIHLAAVSNVAHSWDIPDITAETNVCGTIRLITAMNKTVSNAKLLVVGSGDEYGFTAKEGRPLTEEMPCQPQTPYAISKYCAEQMALQLGKRWNLRVICTRSFNHFGPGQAQGFAISDFASQIAAIEQGQQEPILRVGNLSASRDFTYVTDIVDAYVMLIEQEVDSGIYKVCSGTARTIQEMLEVLLEMSERKIHVEYDEKKGRPSEVPFFVGSNEKLKKAVNWKPKVDVITGLKKTITYWRETISNSATEELQPY